MKAISAKNEYYRLKKAIAPSLLFNQTLYERLISRHISNETIWLDAGTGHKILPAWREQSEQALVAQSRLVCGCDGDRNAIQNHRSLKHRVICDLSALPFKSGTFNLITSNMVLEHLEHPQAVFQEFARSLKQEGLVIVHTPYRWSYFAILSQLIPQRIKNSVGKMCDDRDPEDYYPVRYRCNTPGKLRRLFSKCDLKESQLSMFASDAIFQFLGDRLWGSFLVRMELYFLRLSLRPRWWFLRSSICGIYEKCS